MSLLKKEIFVLCVDKLKRVVYNRVINLNMRFEMSQKTMNLLKESIPTFEMLRDPRRQEILILLFDHKNLTVNEVAEKMTLSRPTVSHHLKLLLQSGLVTVTQKGKERYYDVSFDQAITNLESLLASLKKDASERNS